jgi:hypothetical protein
LKDKSVLTVRVGNGAAKHSCWKLSVKLSYRLRIGEAGRESPAEVVDMIAV